MTTPAVAHRDILARFITTWHTYVGGTQAAPTVPYAIDNRKLVGATTFASVEIINLSRDQVTMGAPGARRFEQLGFIDVRLFGPRDQGRGALDALAGYVREIYEARRVGSGVTTHATSVSEIRNDPEFPGLWCVLARTPFWFHERR